jgi:PAS domain S-box-containing protein
MSEQSLYELSNSEYEDILNLPTHLVAVISTAGRFLKTNVAQARLLGWDPHETFNRDIIDFIFEPDRIQALHVMEQLRSQEISVGELTIRCLCKYGGYHWITWHVLYRKDQFYAVGKDANERMEMENALIAQSLSNKEYQTRFTTFFEQSTLPMQIYSLDGGPLAVNRAWEDLFQTSRAELLNYNALEDPHIKGTELLGFIKRAINGESIEVPSFHYDPKLIDKPGRSLWLEAWVSPVKDDGGKIREIAIILKDVTDKIETERMLIQTISDKKAAEEKFQIISERLSLAVKAGNIGIWEWIPNTNHMSWDGTTEIIFGFSVGAFPHNSDVFTRCIHPEDRDLVWGSIAAALVEKKSYKTDFRIIRRDGVTRWIQGSGMALYDNHGKAYHMMGTVMDITETKEAEEDQKFLSMASDILSSSLNHREILNALCDHAIGYFCDGVFIDQLLPEGNLQRLIVAHTDPEIAQLHYRMDELFPEKFENNPIINPLITGKPYFLEDADVHWEKLRPIEGEDYARAGLALNWKSSIRVRLKGRESVLGMISFFTNKESSKLLTRRHIWLAEELAYRASMAFENSLIHQASQEAIRARDEFLSIASHELKTPLQSLTLQNQMRKRNIDKKLIDTYSPEKLSQMVESDLRHLHRITRLIDDMLDISRIRAGKLTFIKETIELNSLVKDVLDRFRPQLDAAGCFLYFNLSEAMLVEVDIYRTEQVIINLLTNAIKYGAGKPIKVDVIKKSYCIQLHVHDQGPGIQEEDRERIFERFERAISSNEVSGLGLGLYISRQIMEQNGGSLFLRSNPGSGSTFIMELPTKR